MANALIISLIGMGLVFVGLIALWLMMSVLVNLTKEKESLKLEENNEGTTLVRSQELEYKRKAVSAAVAAAMALSASSLRSCDTKTKEAISPWQAANRSRQVSEMHNFPRRKDHS
jgi:Na+-transporting methylmalonyl-CoA/oxaloacetate decarboxylase gamma subunit